MQFMMLSIGMPLALAGCSFGSVSSVPPPLTVADRTVLDEQGALAVELAYKAARRIYQTGNAPSYGAALSNARAAISELLTLIKGPSS